MAPAILGYWNIRGLGQQIRLLLEYTETSWVDKLYVADPVTFSKESFRKEKDTLGLDFPNLPYYIDGELKLSQSKAILRHIARKHNLVPETEEAKTRIDLVDEEVSDLRSSFVTLCYSPDFENKKADYSETLAKKLEMLSKFLGTGTWLEGAKLTYVDFSFYDVLDQILNLVPNALSQFKNLEDYHQRFENLEKIAAYRSSPRFIKFPLNNPQAQFGGGAGVKL